MTTYFKNKEHYLAFCAAWANAVNDPRAKATLCEKMTRQDRSKYAQRSIFETPTQVRKPGWLRGSHHLLFNILCDRDPVAGFTPITTKTRLLNGAYLNHGLWEAGLGLKLYQKDAQRALKDNDMFGSTRLMMFLAPFAGTVTIEMLASIEIPNITSIESNYGKGMEVAKAIIDGDAHPKNMRELYDLIDKEATL